MVIPQLRPTMFLVITLGLIGTWQVFDQMYVMTKGGPAKTTLTPAFLSYQSAFEQQHWGQGAAIAFLLFALILVFTAVQRYIMRDKDAAAEQEGAARRRRRRTPAGGGIMSDDDAGGGHDDQPTELPARPALDGQRCSVEPGRGDRLRAAGPLRAALPLPVRGPDRHGVQDQPGRRRRTRCR